MNNCLYCFCAALGPTQVLMFTGKCFTNMMKGTALNYFADGQ